jgi:hypothetical protein
MESKEIHVGEWLRGIRDQQYEASEGKSQEEVLAFFHREAAAMNELAKRLGEEGSRREGGSQGAIPSAR